MSIGQSDNVAPINSNVPIGADSDTRPGITKKLREILKQDNLVEWLDDRVLDDIQFDLLFGIELDRESMSDYLEQYETAIKLAKMEPEVEDKTFPFVGASRVMMPYLMEAAIDFNSRVVPELIGTQTPCKIRIIGESGESDPVNEKSIEYRADRCSTAINAILTVQIKNWRDDADRESMVLPIVGTTFKKTWYDDPRKQFKSQLVYADELIFNHNTDNFETSPRKTLPYIMTGNEVLTAIRSGEFVGLEEEQFRADKDEDESALEFMESACELDLDDDGYAEPYIVNIHVESEKIVSIVPRFAEEDVETNSKKEVVRITGENLYSIKTFLRDPFGSCMGLGWGIILDPLYKTINAGTRQMIDAGTLNNTAMNSGFMKETVQLGSMQKPNARLKKGVVPMVMGTFTSIPGGSGALKDDFVNFPFHGPSPAVFELLEKLKEEARTLTTAASNVEVNAGQAASLYIAQLQQALKTPTAIMIRLYSGYSQEFKRIYDLIRMYMSDEDYSNLLNVEASVKADFEEESHDVTTTADPSQGSEQERMTKAQTLLDEAKESQGMANLYQAYKQYFGTLGFPDSTVEMVFPKPDPNAKSPMEEAMDKTAEAELAKGQAADKSATARLMDSQIKAVKAGPEIEEIFSKIAKNLADADKADGEDGRFELKEHLTTLREALKIDGSNRNRSDGLAGPSGNQGVSGSP